MRIKERWFDPIKVKISNGVASGVCARYTVPGWLPDKRGAVKVSSYSSQSDWFSFT